MANPRRRTARIGAAGSGAAAVAVPPGERPRQPTVRQRLRYGFDNTMARGTPALVGWLTVLTIGLVGLATAIILLGSLGPKDSSGHRSGLIGQAFKTMLHALDPGTVAGDTGKWPFLLAMFLVTLGGLFVVSALIGVIATGLDKKIEDLRKGRSFVIESGHTLILGWSETVFTILEELAIANENERHPVVVILSEIDRVEMEDLVRAKVGHMGRTRVVCRTGSVIDVRDLGVVNPHEARSVIVLSPDEDDPDVRVIKTLLALTQGPNRPVEPYHIVAEIEDPANLSAARLAGGEEAVLVDKRETISRLIVQTSRQSGLSIAYTEMLDFEGAEIYFREDPALAGHSFEEAVHAYEECSVIGVERSGGDVLLNPPRDTTISASDRVIAVAEDDSQLLAATAQLARPQVDEEAISEPIARDRHPNRILVLGWNRRGTAVVQELDKYLVAGSNLTVVADHADAAADIDRHCKNLPNLRVDFRLGDTTDRRLLESLDPDGHEQVIVLCYSDTLDTQAADARTLVTLLHLRDIAARTGATYTITSEMLDDRNRELAEVTKVDDVIVSDKLISLLLTQISENAHLTQVFEELFRAEGSELYMRPASEYVKVGQPTSFRTIVESALRRGEVAIGYRLVGGNGRPEGNGRMLGVRVNPPKSEQVTLNEPDRVVVLAED